MEVSFPQGLPPENWRRLINEYASILPDSAVRLKFTRNVLKHFHDPPNRGGFHPSWSEAAFRKVLEAEIEILAPGNGLPSKRAIQNGVISQPPFTLSHTRRRQRSIFLYVVSTLALGLFIGAVSLYLFSNQNGSGNSETTVSSPIENQVSFQILTGKIPDQPTQYTDLDDLLENPFPFRLIENQVPFQILTGKIPDQSTEYTTLDDLLENPFSFRLVENHIPFQPLIGRISAKNNLEAVVPDPKPPAVKAPKFNEEEDFPVHIERPIWLVEKTGTVETYSNRLQIITSFCVDNIPRSYVVFPKNTDALPGEDRLSTKVRGILYHASEGDMAPFKPEKNRLLKKYSNQLLKYVCRKKGYHYLIDRFGRVYRTVHEGDAAFHAGNSIWADKDSIFLNLNHAFIGICFEGKGFEEVYEPGSKKPRIRVLNNNTVTDAQVQSGKELTDWLRFHYGIPEGNCVPHGIASVYPKNRLIGYHLDLAHGFPFHRFGLRNKYREMIPSITEFGFKGDRYFRKALNNDVWPGVNRSEEYLKKKAEQAGISVREYRKKLNLRFDRYFDWQKHLHDNASDSGKRPAEGPGSRKSLSKSR